MTVQDPNILNTFILLDRSVALPFSLLITIASVSLCSIIAFYFFRSFKFSGFRYLLGLPMGFAILGTSFVCEHLSLIYYTNYLLYHLFFWMQLSLQSEALALIALSYMLKNRVGSGKADDATADLDLSKVLIHDSMSTKARGLLIRTLPMIVISIPFMVTISALFVQPFLNYVELADLSFYTKIFDMIILGYVFKSTIVSLVKGANVKLLYVPAAFALLWLGQYSLMINYFDNDSIPFVGSIVARLAGLALFVYAIQYAMSGGVRREIEIEARKKT
jgi:hypothetical protein